MNQPTYAIKPNSHKGIPYHKLTMIQRLEFYHSLPTDMRSIDYDRYRKNDYPVGSTVNTPKGKGVIKAKDLFSYNVRLENGEWNFFNSDETTLA